MVDILLHFIQALLLWSYQFDYFLQLVYTDFLVLLAHFYVEHRFLLHRLQIFIWQFLEAHFINMNNLLIFNRHHVSIQLSLKLFQFGLNLRGHIRCLLHRHCHQTILFSSFFILNLVFLKYYYNLIIQ
jgi:hypothetical protein